MIFDLWGDLPLLGRIVFVEFVVCIVALVALIAWLVIS